jgi:hypothetical protein
MWYMVSAKKNFAGNEKLSLKTFALKHSKEDGNLSSTHDKIRNRNGRT